MILNLGCGKSLIQDAINIDIYSSNGVDKVCDFTKLPLEWESNSIDGIYMLHSLEHIPNANALIVELHRILKKGGFLFITVPHSSRSTSVGSMEHYRTYSCYTFRDCLCNNSYMFGKALFTTEINEVRWSCYPYNEKHPYIKFKTSRSSRPPKLNKLLFGLLFKPLSIIIQFFINLSPQTFEYLWCYYVGGASEVVWKGIKV